MTDANRGLGRPAAFARWLRSRGGRVFVGQIGPRRLHLLTILDGLPIAVMLHAANGALLRINPAGVRLLQRLGVDAHRSPCGLLDHFDVVDEHLRPYPAPDLPVFRTVRDGSTNAATLGYALPGGGRAWYAVRAAPVELADRTVGTVVTGDDVTDRQEATHRTEVAERSLRRSFDLAPIGIAVVSLGGVLLEVNAALCELLGDDERHLLGAGLHGFTHPDEPDAVWAGLAMALTTTDDRYVADRRLRHASGRVVHAQLSVALVRAPDGTPLHLIAQFIDVTRRHALEQELRAAAVEDPLTGLGNRRELGARLVDAQHRQARGGGEVVLLYVDLDDFKSINDSHGHHTGDRVLVETGRRLRKATRDVDLVCRVGGDEFIVLCAPIDGQHGLRTLIDRLTSMPPSEFDVDGTQVIVRHSIGAIIVEPDEGLDDALRRADLAMYDAKRRKARERSPADDAAGRLPSGHGS